jgi:hypothetical protein
MRRRRICECIYFERAGIFRTVKLLVFGVWDQELGREVICASKDRERLIPIG